MQLGYLKNQIKMEVNLETHRMMRMLLVLIHVDNQKLTQSVKRLGIQRAKVHKFLNDKLMFFVNNNIYYLLYYKK